MEPTPANTQSENLNTSQNNSEQKTNAPPLESQVFGRSEYAKKEFWDDRFAA